MLNWPSKRRVFTAYKKNPLDTFGLYNDPQLCEFMLSCTQDSNFITQGKLFDLYLSKKESFKNLSVLEVACGNAPSLRAIVEKQPNAKLFGLDNQKCFANDKFDFICAGMENSDAIKKKIPPKSIDYATITWCTLGYLPLPLILEHIKCIYSLLKKGGCYYIGLGDYVCLEDTFDNEPWWQECKSKYGGYGCEFLGEVNPSNGRREIYFCWTDENFKNIHVAKQELTIIIPEFIEQYMKSLYEDVNCYGIYEVDAKTETYDFCDVTYPELQVLVIEKK